jgi:L-ascorbate metabolism protein UlaG (beta-lactamase superfamily)
VALAPDAVSDIDAVLISHVHYDHFDRPSLRRFGKDAVFVVPLGSRGLLRGFLNVNEVGVGDEVSVGPVRVRATPAVHVSGRLTVRSAPSLGYVISGSRQVYFAGDTDVFDEMRSLSGSLDVALLPVAGWGPKVGPGHLDPLRAAQAARLLEPRIAVPIHWGTYTLPFKAASPDPPEAFRRHVAELAPDVEVRVLEPGASSTF